MKNLLEKDLLNRAKRRKEGIEIGVDEKRGTLRGSFPLFFVDGTLDRLSLDSLSSFTTGMPDLLKSQVLIERAIISCDFVYLMAQFC